VAGAERGDCALVELVSRASQLLEVMPVRRRPAARRHVHVDERVLPGGFLTCDEDRVGIADQPEVRRALVVIRPRGR
jgi:hypothetical protein